MFRHLTISAPNMQSEIERIGNLTTRYVCWEVKFWNEKHDRHSFMHKTVVVREFDHPLPEVFVPLTRYVIRYDQCQKLAVM